MKKNKSNEFALPAELQFSDRNEDAITISPAFVKLIIDLDDLLTDVDDDEEYNKELIDEK